MPAFNEGRRLPSTLDQLLVELPLVVPGAWEVVVVDDGSTDDTHMVVESRRTLGALRLVRLPQNVGKGAAQAAGVRAARHALVLLLDADLPIPVVSVPELMSAVAAADLVCGSRRLPGARVDPPQPLVRRVGGRGFRTVVSMLGFGAVSDPQCGVKVLRRDELLPVLDRVTCQGFAFDVELIVRARRAGLRVCEHPVVWRHVPGSSLRPLRDAVATIGELVRLRYGLQPPVPTASFSGRGR